ncbi:MAG TPA: peptidase domain-containing ABC transporter [Streptosporangiaceae bacterium]|jgi:ABC-type bacteriocin/lantibiotic exporter with double-glycine peptidase domain
MTRRVPLVRQMEEADCGAACLAMALGYLGRRVPLDELRAMTGTGRDGVTALSLLHAARAYGLTARGVRADLPGLRDLPRGTILHWEFSHFVVLDGMTRSGIRVIDPALGRRVVREDELRRAYTGVAIALERGAEFVPGGPPARGTWRYLRPILGQARSLSKVVVTSLILRVSALALPLMTALVIDQVVPRDDHHLLVLFAIGVAMVIAYQLLGAFLRGNLLLELRTRLDMGLTIGFVDHLVELPYSFFLRRSSGDLMMRMQSNTSVREILTSGSLSALLDGVFASFYLILLIIVSPAIGSLVVVLALVEILTLVASWRRNRRLMSDSLQAQADSQSYAYELLAGIETLKAAGAEQRAAQHWAGLFKRQVGIDLARGRLGAAVDSVMSTLTIGSPLLVLLLGTMQVVSGRLSLGTMFAASALAAGFLSPLGTLVSSGLQLQLLASYMERISDVLDTPGEQAGQQLRQAAPLGGALQARDVSFRYSALSPAVVRNVSLDIHPGQHVGIVGRSGSGKSTLAHLLLGLYRPTEGQICFDGQDLAELDARSIRRQLGIVTQHPYVFGSSIRQNIALTNPGLPAEAVAEAARLACIDADIGAMPLGYETLLHDGGGSLSGGQRQRIALARALVSSPAILLLDEATSELDTVTEKLVYRNLAAIRATTIVIAHRLSTVRNADLIIVMDDGRIAESGTHQELVALGGLYAAMVTAQPSMTDGIPNARPPAPDPVPAR